MADRLEPHAEAPPQPLDIIGLRLRRREERAIRHDERAGEVIGEADAGKLASLLSFDHRIARQPVDQRTLLQKRELRRHLEGLLAVTQVGRDAQCPALRIIAALARRTLVEQDSDLMPLGQPGHQAAMDGPRRKAGGAVKPLRRLIQLREMMMASREIVAHLLEGLTRQAIGGPFAAELLGHDFAPLHRFPITPMQRQQRPADTRQSRG